MWRQLKVVRLTIVGKWKRVDAFARISSSPPLPMHIEPLPEINPQPRTIFFPSSPATTVGCHHFCTKSRLPSAATLCRRPSCPTLSCPSHCLASSSPPRSLPPTSLTYTCMPSQSFNVHAPAQPQSLDRSKLSPSPSEGDLDQGVLRPPSHLSQARQVGHATTDGRLDYEAASYPGRRSLKSWCVLQVKIEDSTCLQPCCNRPCVTLVPLVSI